MKFSDYRRLAKISLKSRKKTTRATVRGITFGLILIMPVLFIVMAFYIGLDREVNKEKDIRTFNLGFSSVVTTDYSASYAPTSKFDDVIELPGVDDYVKYQKYIFNKNGSSRSDNNLNLTVTYNGNKYSEFELNKIDNGNTNPAITIFDLANCKDNNVLLSNDKDALKAGNVFSKESKSEVMISSSVAAKLSTNINDLIGKKISLSTKLTDTSQLTSSKTSRTNDFEILRGSEIDIFNEFKIVGIFDSNIITKPYRNSNSNFNDELFWITYDSLYNSKGEAYIGTPVGIEDKNSGYTNYLYYYPTSELLDYSESATDAGYAFIPLGASLNIEKYIYSNGYYKEYGLYLSFDSYKNADRATTIIDSYIESTSSNDEKYIDNYSYKNTVFSTYQIFYQVFLYLSLALAIFGGVIFFATLLNLYNTIEFSVQTRKNYLGLLRAIGMKNNSITKLYFVEVLKIFTRSYIWTIIFGGGICVGIYFAFQAAMKTEAAKIITINLTLNPVFIPISFIILVVFDTLIALVFALISCYKVSHKPLLEVLVDDK